MGLSDPQEKLILFFLRAVMMTQNVSGFFQEHFISVYMFPSCEVMRAKSSCVLM